jgi:choline-sulfatase
MGCKGGDAIRRAWRGSFAALALVSALAAAAAEAGPSVLLVTLDTTRADHVGEYGAVEARTPVLDRLARSGTCWVRALTPAPLTLPAHASILTGLDPPAHGVRDNGTAALPAGLPHLAEALSARGWHTAAFVGSLVLDRRFGLSRGFERYDDRMSAEAQGEYGYPERDAKSVTDAAAGWLAEQARADPRRPVFVWVHYYDAHAPYAPPMPWRGTTAERSYAGEIAYVDHELGRLLEAAPARRLVAVVGDHGEALGEHGERTHGVFLYRASLEVPLVLAGAGVPAGRLVDGPVSTRRLAATLLRLVGADTTVGPPGPPLPGWDGGAGPRDPEPVYSETRLPASVYGWSPLEAITEGRWRLVSAPRPELYDEAADPMETRNRHAEQPAVEARLRQELVLRAAAFPTPASRPAPMDPELAEALRGLGYLSGASGSSVGTIDPKDGIGMLEELEEAKAELGQGEIDRPLGRLEDLVRRSPGNVPFLTHLAQAQRSAGRGEQAVATLRRAVELNPSLDFLEANLAEALAALGRGEEARRCWRRALALNPRLARASLGLAELEMRDGHAEEERLVLRQAVEAGAESFAVYARLGQVEMAAADWQAAEEHLRRAVALAPGWDLGWLLWSQTAEAQGRHGEALDRAQRAVLANPDNPVALLRAGRLLVAAGQGERGRPLLERAARLAPGTATGAEARRLVESLSGSRSPDQPPP